MRSVAGRLIRRCSGCGLCDRDAITKMLARFAGDIASWLGPSTKSFDLTRIYVVSAIIGFFFLFFGAFAVETGFSNYTDWADSIVSGATLTGRPTFYIRDVGMPLILLASGYSFTQSLLGVAIIQFLMGMTMPALVYLALRPWFPRTAYFAGLASALSLGPFVLAKTMHHDQPYIFFMILSLYLTNRYIDAKRPSGLYGLTISVFLLSLIRQTGKSLYPGLIFLCLLFGRKNYMHTVASVVLFLACNFGYSKYRDYMIGDLPAVGQEIFENLYFNSSEFGVKLSPDDGPNMKFILDRVYQCMLPSPAHAKNLTGDLAPSNPQFMATYIYKLTADEFYEWMLTHTNFVNLLFIEGCMMDGIDAVTANHVYIMAWLETARAHPLFITEYALRNSWELLYDPGWLHARNSTEPHLRGGLNFQLGGASMAGRPNIGDRLPEPALSEAKFIPLVRQPAFVQNIYLAIESAWVGNYQPVTKLLFYLTCVTWISSVIGLLHTVFGTTRLSRWSSLWLANRVLPATSAVSFLLLANIAVTGLFVDSYYRYDHSLIVLKVILATVGCAVVLNLLRAVRIATRARDRMLFGNQ
jgi:Dolichyl-phosphate-mannose-protein mannosyltransferase